MNRQEAQKWCQENNWTKLRLTQGNWVAVPPSKSREMPLPVERQLTLESRLSPFLNLAQAIILLIAAALVAAIAILISPFFASDAISRHKKSQSQGQLRE